MDTPQAPGSASAPMKPKEGGSGALFGIVVIIILLALGGIYYFTSGVQNMQQSSEDADAAVANEAAAIMAQGTSSNLNDIEADVNATNFGALDSAAANVDAANQ